MARCGQADTRAYTRALLRQALLTGEKEGFVRARRHSSGPRDSQDVSNPKPRSRSYNFDHVHHLSCTNRDGPGRASSRPPLERYDSAQCGGGALPVIMSIIGRLKPVTITSKAV